MTDTATPHPLPAIRDEVRRVIGEALGAASMCWHPRPAGEFDSAAAVKVAEKLEAQLTDLTGWTEPNLGLATTRQLRDELEARIADPHSAADDYRTVGD